MAEIIRLARPTRDDSCDIPLLLTACLRINVIGRIRHYDRLRRVVSSPLPPPVIFLGRIWRAVSSQLRRHRQINSLIEQNTHVGTSQIMNGETPNPRLSSHRPGESPAERACPAQFVPLFESDRQRTRLRSPEFQLRPQRFQRHALARNLPELVSFPVDMHDPQLDCDRGIRTRKPGRRMISLDLATDVSLDGCSRYKQDVGGQHDCQ